MIYDASALSLEKAVQSKIELLVIIDGEHRTCFNSFYKNDQNYGQSQCRYVLFRVQIISLSMVHETILTGNTAIPVKFVSTSCVAKIFTLLQRPLRTYSDDMSYLYFNLRKKHNSLSLLLSTPILIFS